MIKGNQFERDTSAFQTGDGKWSANISSGWRIGQVPCGGYILAIAARALQQALSKPDPLSVHILFVAPTEIGAAELNVEGLKHGGAIEHGMVKLHQQGKLRAVVTGSYTDLSELRGETWNRIARPNIPPFDRCPAFAEHGIELRRRINQHFSSGAEALKRQPPNGTGRYDGWLSFTDHASPDALALLMFSDAYPPPIFTVFGVQGWVPTIELTVQIRRRPSSGPIQVLFQTRAMTSGVMENDGMLWDSSGELVALSRQTARLRILKSSAHEDGILSS